MNTPTRMARNWHGAATALLAVVLSECTTTPSAADLQSAEIGSAPASATCEAAARSYLAHAGAGRAPVAFAAVERGWYRIDMLSPTRFAWHLAAKVGGATATDGIAPKAYSFYFESDRLVAVGAVQPHRNRTTISDLWVVTAIEPDGTPTSGRYLGVTSAPAATAAADRTLAPCATANHP